MIYTIEVKPEVARSIDAKAVDKGLTPEEFLMETIERVVLQSMASDAEVRRVDEKIRAERERTAQG